MPDPDEGPPEAASVTLTVTDALFEPPLPVQLSPNVAELVSALVCTLPDGVCEPLQPPEAVQDVASVEDQVSVVVEPDMTDVGCAEIVTVGAGVVGGGVELAVVTVTAFCVLCPLPTQVSVNVTADVIEGSDSLPAVDFVPVQPPDAVHDVAPLDVQVSVVACPLCTGFGLAASVTDGAPVVLPRGITAQFA